MFSCADAMREAANEYADLPIKTRTNKTVKLRNFLMLNDEGMKSAKTILSAFGEKSDDVTAQLPKLKDLLRVLADKPADMETEFEDWPAAMFLKVVAAWQEATEMGEASDSQS